MSHVGVAVDDRRNAGIIEYFRPKVVTPDDRMQALAKLQQTLAKSPIGERSSRLRSLLQRTMRNLASGQFRPDPPLSQPVEAVADPWSGGLGTHPDIIERLWALDDGLPQRCRWALWGGPALVHPATGVTFARAFGTIGVVWRLPPHELAHADARFVFATMNKGRGKSYDISPAGPEWRFIAISAPAALQAQWCRAAYEFAGEPLHG